MLNNKKTKEQFLDIAYLLSSSLDLQFILNKITEERTLSLLSSKRAVIYLLDSKKGFLKPVATLNNPNVAQIMSGKLPVKSSLSGNVVKTKKATIFNNTSQYSNAYHIPGTLVVEDENLLVLPLIVEKTILGTLNLYRNRELYLKEDVKYAKIFALYASTAINNALKHQQLIREISDRKQSEAKLRESEERFRILFESSHDALMTLNPPTWKFTSGNPAIAKMFNVKNVKEFLTYGPWDISPVKQPDGKLSSEKAIEMIEIAMTKGSNFFEWTHKRINGKSFPTTVLLTRIQLKDKTFLQVTVRDITERKKAEEEVQKYQHELEELVDERTAKLEIANKELEAFSYSVSHDLRAPLRAIDGFTRMLIEDYATKLDKEGKRLGNTIHDNAKKMGKLIDDLLDFSRVGRASMTLTKIDMKNIVNTVYHEATSAEERKRIKFNVANLPPIDGDTNLMRQVWMNLIKNAIKYSSKRKQAIISVTSQEEKNKVTYCIKDNGAGFNMKYVDKLFGVFKRLHNEKDFKGTGIGLSLVQRIIKRHDGNVWAEGEVDKGASFYFSLPNKVK